ncbi:TM116 protein, partial [Polyodon spathula]|nr:TM116 protein [Polyodon spathula]
MVRLSPSFKAGQVCLLLEQYSDTSYTHNSCLASVGIYPVVRTQMHAVGKLLTGTYLVYDAVRWIQFIMAILSILGSGSIITYAAFQNLIKTPEIRPLFYLSFTDLLLGVSWLVGAVLYREPLGSQNIACYNLQSIGHVRNP